TIPHIVKFPDNGDMPCVVAVKKWALYCDSFIHKMIAIKHLYATPDEWKNRFKNLFISLQKDKS
ncbi:hypothetical protein U2439_28725, partial [Klebsiella pneumoniae]|uniref:hypothetical protein n=1 Tax=Klebsiella pneumoniae TaxID=573 RepID=UPI0037C001D4